MCVGHESLVLLPDGVASFVRRNRGQEALTKNGNGDDGFRGRRDLYHRAYRHGARPADARHNASGDPTGGVGRFPRLLSNSSLSFGLCTIIAVACTPKPGPQAAPTSETALTTASQSLNDFLEKAFQRHLARRPQLQTFLGEKTNYDKWNDISDAFALETEKHIRADLAALRAQFQVDKLSAADKLSYTLFEYEAERRLSLSKWRHYGYLISQMRGMQQAVPAFLMNFHRVDTLSDARAYIARLRGVGPLFVQLFKNMRIREKEGILPPAFVYPMALRDCHNVLVGSPFESTNKPSTLLADFQRKVDKLKIHDEERSQLIAEARAALSEVVKPAYQSLITLLKEQQARAKTDHGVWKLPEGAAFYRAMLNFHTTTTMTPEEIHKLGIQEVERIHGEMKDIMKQVKFKGSLQQFFKFMRDDPQFYFPTTDEGRAAYLKEVDEVIDHMRAKLPELFSTLPRSPLVVKRVEAFREKSAGKAFYNRGTPDGTRPGVYYANLFDMGSMPKYQMQALAFHEAIPGHHMQLSIAQELENVPRFRKNARYTAYSEGWGLYAELVAKEVGFYSDPYSDFGRLSMELWRALRLVVDTGLHYYKWSREKAIQYLLDNASNSERVARKSVERYMVMPGQATAYKVGMLKILELRAKARARLGDKFDIRAFHDVVLTNGLVPLTFLENLVDTWIASVEAG